MKVVTRGDGKAETDEVKKKESGKRGKRKKNGKRNAVSAQALADTH